MNKFFLITLLFISINLFSQKIDLAITNCNVITMKSKKIKKNKTILISGDKIISIIPSTNFKNLDNTKIIDAKGKYIIPSLADMHIHSNPNIDKYAYPMFLKYGITTLRIMAGNQNALKQRDSIKNGLVKNYPDLYIASELIDGNPPSFGENHEGPIVTDANQIEKVIDNQITKGYDFIKLYSRLKSDIFFKALEYSKLKGYKTTYHIPVTLDKNQYYNQFSGEIQHLSGYGRFVTKYDSLPKKVLLANYDVPFDQVSSEDIDSKKLKSAIKQTKKYNVWNCPTLVLFHNGTDEQFCKSVIENKIGTGLDGLIDWWKSTRYGKNEKVTNYVQFEKNIVKHLPKDKILAGTDYPNPWLIPGLSLHQELEQLVDAGLTNYEALKTSTVNPSIWFGEKFNKGTIEVGKQADLIILNKNPLENIKNTKDIYKVIYKGKIQ